MLLNYNNFRFYLKLLIFLSFFSFKLQAQVLVIDPAFATQDDSITVIYDASKGNAGLLGESKVIAHTGVITSASTSGSDWKYVQGSWGVDFAKTRMTSMGNNKWFISFRIRSFYGVPANETIQKLAFVFHNAGGNNSKKGADVGGADLFITLSSGSYQARFVTPLKHSFYSTGETLNIKAMASVKSELKLFLNGQELAFAANDTVLTHAIAASELPEKARFVLQGINGSSTSYDTTYVIRKGYTQVANPPQGTKDGINYLNDSSVVLQLYAPNKDFVFAWGDFSNWELDSACRMIRTPDGKRYWVQLNQLEKGREYRFQYVINESKLLVPDCYAEKLLDPWNDKYIPAQTYPNLIPYPVGLTTEVVSVFQTSQIPYNWLTSGFQKPPVSKLVIYELLLRDFIARHDFQTLKDTLMYLKNLGVNVLELMPVNEFDGNESWGYNPNFYFALDKYYGTKDAFKALVDECHKLGIAVVIDMVLNHSFGMNPQVRMYFNPNTGKPQNNPWFNADATHPYNVGYDYNHESQDTKDFVDRVLKFWVEEYRIDGYRFDLSKGFTQKNSGSDVGGWSAYDQSRINIWKRIRDEFRKSCSDCYMILEHLGDNSEEKVLADEGFIMWGKMTEQFNEATMGYAGSKQNLSWGNYKSRSFSYPNLVTYAESHDEERLMFKNKTYGNTNGSYSVKNTNTALQRMEAAMAMLLPLKGPKMIWQFGELGYDISIDQNGRTGNKPILWNYATEPARKKLYTTTAALAKLKMHPSFDSDNYVYDVAGTGKMLKVSDSSMNSIILANFDMNAIALNPGFQQTGWWYDYMTGDSMQVSNLAMAVNLNPGEFKVYTTKNLNPSGILNSLEGFAEHQLDFNVYPNPAKEQLFLSLQNSDQKPEVDLVDATGRIFTVPIIAQERASKEWILALDLNHISEGIYFLRVKTSVGTGVKQLVIHP
ncbi:MAG: T9SS type A sorting domain-containing protein [Bacteroidia bacterium]|nr:T9SS type A sorting domain-containing protein [Bacteroidia bacterium]